LLARRASQPGRLPFRAFFFAEPAPWAALGSPAERGPGPRASRRQTGARLQCFFTKNPHHPCPQRADWPKPRGMLLPSRIQRRWVALKPRPSPRGWTRHYAKPLIGSALVSRCGLSYRLFQIVSHKFILFQLGYIILTDVKLSFVTFVAPMLPLW